MNDSDTIASKKLIFNLGQHAQQDSSAKVTYLTQKFKEQQSHSAQLTKSLNDKSFLNQKLQEELLKRNTQLAALESRLKDREDEITKLELADKVRK